jgi:DNA-binding transcriptional LysR family regulator
MDLMLTEAEPPEALRMLRAGYVDVALVFQHYQAGTDPAPPTAAEDGTRGRLLLDEPVHLVTAARPDAAPGRPELADYAGHRWIAGCERCRSYLLRQCALAGFTPKVAFTTDDYVAVQALVAAGLGVTTLPGLCLRAARHPGITVSELPGARRHVFAVTYGDPPDPPATARLLEVLTQAAAGPASAAAAAAAPGWLTLEQLARPEPLGRWRRYRAMSSTSSSS